VIVIDFPTMMDGTVVRWYHSVGAAKASESIISASRNAVIATGEITPEVFSAAWAIHERLKADPCATVADVTTHRKSLLGGAITPIVRDEVGT
jgi:hypothetical protein